MAEANLHLEAAQMSKRVDELLFELTSGDFSPSMHGEVAQLIRFFGKNIAKLQECNEAVLKIAQLFFLLSEREKWSNRDANAFLLTITTMILKRNDDLVIRQLCDIMKDFTKLQTAAQLKNLAVLHQKAALMIFHKLSKVSTNFTQSKLLNVLHLFLEVLDDSGKKTISNVRLVKQQGRQMIEETIRLFSLIDSNDFLWTCRDFLSFYNTKIIQEVFTATFIGHLSAINGKKTTYFRMFADFNMRNLSIAVHVSSVALLGNTSETGFCFVEMEECEVEAKTGMFEDPEQIEVTVTPSRHQILDANDKLINSVNIESVKLVIISEGDEFMSSILRRYQDKLPMIADNMTENESLISYLTAKSTIANAPLETKQVTKPQQDDSADIFTPSQRQSQIPLQEPVQVAEPEKKRQAAKVVPSQSAKKTQESPRAPFVQRIAVNQLSKPAVSPSIYDDVPHDAKLPSFHKFMQKQRYERQAKKQPIQCENIEPSAPDNSKDVDWKPAGATKTRGAKKTPGAKQRSPANKRAFTAKTVKQETKKSKGRVLDYSSELEDGVLEMFGVAFEEDKEVVRAPVAKTRAVIAQPNPKAKLPMTKAEKQAYDDAEDAIVMECLPSRRQKTPPKKRSAAQSKAQPKAAVVTIKTAPVARKRPTIPAKDSAAAKKAKAFDEGVMELPNRQQMLQAHKTLASSSEEALEEIQSKAFRPVSVQQGVSNDAQKQVKPAPKVTTAVMTRTKNAFDSLLVDKENMPAPLKTTMKKAPTANGVLLADFINFIKPPISKPSMEPEPVEKSEVIRPQQKHKEPREVVYNLELLKDNERLEKFINDSSGSAKNFNDEPQQNLEEIVEEKQYRADNYVVRTQTIQKKTSPTTIQTVQIQEINFSPPQNRHEVASPRHGENSILANIYKEKAGKVIGPILDEFFKIDVKEVTATAATEENFRQARAEIVETNKRLISHSKEHVKLLKRLQHSKRNLMQLRDIHNEKVAKYLEALKQVKGERRQAFKQRAERIKAIPAEIESKEMELKKEIWQEYVESVTSNIQDMLKSYSDL